LRLVLSFVLQQLLPQLLQLKLLQFVLPLVLQQLLPQLLLELLPASFVLPADDLLRTGSDLQLHARDELPGLHRVRSAVQHLLPADDDLQLLKLLPAELQLLELQLHLLVLQLLQQLLAFVPQLL
jgi:hypothetical protein